MVTIETDLGSIQIEVTNKPYDYYAVSVTGELVICSDIDFLGQMIARALKAASGE
jgi:hypothetical protein